jgi:four helix bundle protein
MFPYERLSVYTKAYAINQAIYRFVNGHSPVPQYIKTQLGRASLSIMLNIAEGSAKPGGRDRRNFFVIARGSVFECASLISFLQEAGGISAEFKTHIYGSLLEISKMLYVMIKNLEK